MPGYPRNHWHRAGQIITPGGDTAQELIDLATGPQGPQGPPGESLLQKATSTLQSSDILALYTTPFVLVPAPGIGKWINMHRATLAMKWSNTQYTVGDGAYIGFSGVMNVSEVTSAFSGWFADTLQSVAGVHASSILPNQYENLPLELWADTSNPTSGDGVLTVIVYYTIEDIPV